MQNVKVSRQLRPVWLDLVPELTEPTAAEDGGRLLPCFEVQGVVGIVGRYGQLADSTLAVEEEGVARNVDVSLGSRNLVRGSLAAATFAVVDVVHGRLLDVGHGKLAAVYASL